MRIALALTAAAAAALAAAPASAAYRPICQTQLVHAAAGTSAGCATQMIGDTNDNSFHTTRTATIEVVAGSASLTLTCSAPWRTWTKTITVTGPAVDWIMTSDDHQCVATATALTDGTTATVTSTFARGINWY